GVTRIWEGAIQAASNGALGASSINDSTNVSAGAALEISGNVIIAEPITFTGTGIAGTGAIRNVSGSNILIGTVGVIGSASIGVDTGSNLEVDILEGATATNLTKVGSGTLILAGGGYTVGQNNALSANFGSGTSTGTVTNGQTTITSVQSVTNLVAGMSISGTNIPAGTTIVSILGNSNIVMSNAATGTGNATYTFSGSLSNFNIN